ncbi:ORF6N domain-containing protein [Spirosomataceae bacterium TFI 002]|nr:ORF6N domain-containing protein [Spirosomataceae bacterium TFI 002]
MSENLGISAVLIENRIFTLRGEQVMLDFQLGELYQVETKRLNEQVKRNEKRFPPAFMFQLSKTEWETLQSHIATSSNQSQIATGSQKHRSKPPYVFTEQGVSMLSAVLNSDTAINVSIAIMNAFVQMRKTIGNHQQLLQLSNDFVAHKLETNQKFEQVFKALEAPEIKDKQGIFFDGQTYDAYDFVNGLIKKAKASIILIDNYIDETVVTQLTKKEKGVKVFLLSKTISKKLQLDIDKANTQYPTFKGIAFNKSHDRFLILDENEVYHIGASLKKWWKKLVVSIVEPWFAFSKLESASVTILQSINEHI